ncbi:hypothetical protein [Streptomyces sp. ODS05-4]|uniref:hypothetical protein n=1 Tax=Streptomyces sp. ODS05-4 TaxID=2944939 RepID=UPI00210C2B62|nr:hypothetical protein [Streptomyces sp. ODS05-4]
MSTRQPAPAADGGGAHGADEPVSELVPHAPRQLTELVRGETKPAQAEIEESAHR